MILPTVGRGNGCQPTASEEQPLRSRRKDLLFCPIVGAMLAGSLSGVRLKVLLTFSVGPKRKRLRESLPSLCGWIGAAPARTKEGCLSGIVKAHDQDRVLVPRRGQPGASNHEQGRETAHLLLLHEMADKASHESIHCSSFPGLLPPVETL